MLRLMRKSLLFVFLFSVANYSTAQDKLNIKFGKITPADFIISSPVIDSNTNAVILSDIGSSHLDGNNKGWFSLIFTRHKRVKVLNHKGMDIATVDIRLYKSGTGAAEQLEDVNAVTYNMENGGVVVTRLDSKSVFTEQTNKNIVTKKFTFPAVKEGSIIEYTYTIKSDFLFNLQSWAFQSSYPCLWSEYEVNIPEFFNYVYLSQGYLRFDVNEKKRSLNNFLISNSEGAGATRSARIQGEVNTNRWVVKNVPAIKEEPFTSTLRNHISKIEFQLSEYRLPDQPTQPVMGSWKTVGEELLKRENFGQPISRSNNWLDNELVVITKGAANKVEAARKTFEYLRDNFTCTSFGTGLSGSMSLKDIFKNKNGSVADINLLLVAMLRHQKIDASPVLLSTRANGFIHPIYPLMDRFNYLVCLATIDSSEYSLDASIPRIGFGKLPAYCYNGNARVITDEPTVIPFNANSLSESKLTNVFIINNDKGKMEGFFSSTLGYYASLNLRDKLAKTDKADFFKEIAKPYPAEIKTENYAIDSLQMYDDPVMVKYDINIDFNGENVIYFNPMMVEATKENLFKSLKRLYPVEMPYTVDDTYLLTMDIPKGYVVDELPKSERVKLNEDEGMFEYIVSSKNGKIQFRRRLQLLKANYDMEDYDALREFFNYVVKKESEQVVFKKIN